MLFTLKMVEHTPDTLRYKDLPEPLLPDIFFKHHSSFSLVTLLSPDSIHSFSMSVFTLSVAALAIASFASAKPIAPRVDTKTGFTVSQSVAVPKLAGPVALVNAMMKYGVTPSSDAAAAASSGTGTVAANPEQYDSEYLCKHHRRSRSIVRCLTNLDRCRRYRWPNSEPRFRHWFGRPLGFLYRTAIV